MNRSNNATPSDSCNHKTLMTYAEWQNSGYHVIKGQRSRERDDKGTPLFSTDQVKAIKVRAIHEIPSWSHTPTVGPGPVGRSYGEDLLDECIDQMLSGVWDNEENYY